MRNQSGLTGWLIVVSALSYSALCHAGPVTLDGFAFNEVSIYKNTDFHAASGGMYQNTDLLDENDTGVFLPGTDLAHIDGSGGYNAYSVESRYVATETADSTTFSVTHDFQLITSSLDSALKDFLAMMSTLFEFTVSQQTRVTLQGSLNSSAQEAEHERARILGAVDGFNDEGLYNHLLFDNPNGASMVIGPGTYYTQLFTSAGFTAPNLNTSLNGQARYEVRFQTVSAPGTWTLVGLAGVLSLLFRHYQSRRRMTQLTISA